MLIDLHLHTSKYSPNCSVLDPWELSCFAKRARLQGIVITDHLCRWEDKELYDLRNSDLFISSGREVHCKDNLHVLVYGVRGSLPRIFDAVSLAKNVNDRGGAVILAHPFRFSNWRYKSINSLGEVWKNFHAVECFSGSHSFIDNKRALQICNYLEIPSCGGSDAHIGKDLGRIASCFENNIDSERALVSAIREGKLEPMSVFK